MTHDERVNEIMDYFEFGKCAKMMKAVNWTWFHTDPVLESDLRQTARRLLNDLTDNIYSSTGGLRAMKNIDGSYSLIFGPEWTTE